ncbi:hypothetical protein HanPSC8_Chr06g0234351 [Helianthus annuus]|nr:hypothetical protein HanPSC8_Chr06g0234351 [Helianthus annuus]
MFGRSNGTNPYEFTFSPLPPLIFFLVLETVEVIDLRSENEPNWGLNWRTKLGLGLGF